MGQANSKNI